jgi:hypothetical protein
MIERVARAICADDEDGDESKWSRYYDNARAAIAAMREPTREMLDALLPPRSSITDARYESRRDLRPLIYRAMIDAALAKATTPD